MSLDEIATATRIPTRHLQSLEDSEFDKMPSPTYSIGFAKNYAGAVGLDRAEIGDMVRTEMGGYRPPQAVEYYEPSDPSRAFPKWLVVAVLAALAIVVGGFSWLKSRELDAPDAATASEAAVPDTAAPTAAAPAAAAAGPVAITANDVVWAEIKDGNGAILFQGEMQKGQRFEVPASASAPVLKTGRPEALAVSVGTTVVPPVGEAGKPVANVSLLAADLLKPRPATPAPTASATPAAPAPRTARPAPRPATPAPVPAASAEPAPAAAEPANGTAPAQ